MKNLSPKKEELGGIEIEVVDGASMRGRRAGIVITLSGGESPSEVGEAGWAAWSQPLWPVSLGTALHEESTFRVYGSPGYNW